MMSKTTKILKSAALLSSLLNLQITTTNAQSDCFNGKTTNYNGTQSVTETGKTCQIWFNPKNDSRTMPDNPKDRMTNYCRNPQGDGNGPWCYVDKIRPTDPHFEYCGIHTCDQWLDTSMIVFGLFDVEQEISRVQSFFAHYEQSKKFQKKFVDFSSQIQFFNTDPEMQEELKKHDLKPVEFSESGHEFWAIAADEMNDRILISDYYDMRLLSWNYKTKKLKLELEHVGSNMDSIAVDWRTGNVYWIDSGLDAIMVANSDFTHFTKIPLQEKPVAVAVEPMSGKLIYSSASISELKDDSVTYKITVC